MPLPSMYLYGAKQCTATTKRTKQPCKNPAAYGCRTCRLHGARKLETIKRGEEHVNFVHGRRTLEAEKEHSAFCRRLQQLEDAMHLLGMTSAKRSRGRKANGYVQVKNVVDIKKLIG